jgi:hypothetical protein
VLARIGDLQNAHLAWPLVGGFENARQFLNTIASLTMVTTTW